MFSHDHHFILFYFIWKTFTLTMLYIVLMTFVTMMTVQWLSWNDIFPFGKKKSKSNERVWRLFSQKLFDKPTSLTSLTNSITNFYHKQWRVIWWRQRNAHWHWQSVIYKVCSLLFNQILILKKSILRFDFSQSKLLI